MFAYRRTHFREKGRSKLVARNCTAKFKQNRLNHAKSRESQGSVTPWQTTALRLEPELHLPRLLHRQPTRKQAVRFEPVKDPPVVTASRLAATTALEA